MRRLCITRYGSLFIIGFFVDEIGLQVTAATYPQGGKVNYHEAVVYREDAICANAIVVYS